jgi:hypothetical protein
MEEKCLAFFQKHTSDTLELFHIRNTSKYVEFTIQNPGKTIYGHTCITLKIQKDLSLMEVVIVQKCSLTGNKNMTIAIEFAKEQFILMIQLVDASSIDYTLSTGELQSISFKKISMLEKGNTWYERMGFLNSFDQYRGDWMHCIDQSFPEIYASLVALNDLNDLLDEHKGYFKDPEKLYKYTGLTVDAPIHVLFSRINVFLQKNCPKEHANKCNPTIDDHDFVFLNGFVEKSFEVLMLALHPVKWFRELVKKIETYDYYYRMLYLPNGMQVTLHGLRNESMNGLKGKISGITKERYKIELEDKTVSIKFENVKIGGRKTRRSNKRI